MNITEDPPTSDQLRTILEYVGAKRAGDVVKDAKDEADAMKKLRENGENFKRPVVSVLSAGGSSTKHVLTGCADCRLE